MIIDDIYLTQLYCYAKGGPRRVLTEIVVAERHFGSGGNKQGSSEYVICICSKKTATNAKIPNLIPLFTLTSLTFIID